MVSLWAQHGREPGLRLEYNFLASFTNSRDNQHHIDWQWMEKIKVT